MRSIKRIKNRLIAKIITRFPGLVKVFLRSHHTPVPGSIPWTPLDKPLRDSIVAVITTAGVHLRNQEPFNMLDPEGDPTYRAIPAGTVLKDLAITHDYYDHKDADKDIDIVFPLNRLQEFAAEGIIGKVSEVHFSFMGHIKGRHIQTLTSRSAPEAASRLLSLNVDCAVLTPG